MKILIFGRGVISTQYAWALEKAGNTVEFYVRPASIEKYGNTIQLGFLDARLNSKGMIVKENWPVIFRDDIPIDNDYDVIFVSVNDYQIESAVSFIAPRVGKATVLFFNNFWDDPRKVMGDIPLNQIVWGFPGGGGGFDHNGTLRGGFMKSVTFGTMDAELSTRDIAVRNLFKQAGFKITEQKDMRSWLWNHYILNVAMEPEVLKAGSFDTFFDSQELLANLGLNIRELVPVLKARGAKIDVVTRLFTGFPVRVLGFILKWIVFKKNGLARRLMDGANPFLGHASREVLSDARKLGVPVPRLAAYEYLFKN